MPQAVPRFHNETLPAADSSIDHICPKNHLIYDFFRILLPATFTFHRINAVPSLSLYYRPLFLSSILHNFHSHPPPKRKTVTMTSPTEWPCSPNMRSRIIEIRWRSLRGIFNLTKYGNGDRMRGEICTHYKEFGGTDNV